MSARTASYWTTTALTAFAFLTGGMAYLSRADFAVGGMAELGYPAYFVTILGAWKLLGGLAILAPQLPRVKEWALRGHRVRSHRSGVLAPRNGPSGGQGNRAARALRDRRRVVGSPACKPRARRPRRAGAGENRRSRDGGGGGVALVGTDAHPPLGHIPSPQFVNVVTNEPRCEHEDRGGDDETETNREARRAYDAHCFLDDATAPR
jgi:DoxX-like family